MKTSFIFIGDQVFFYKRSGVSYKITAVCLWIPHNCAEWGLWAAKTHTKKEPVSEPVAVFGASCDLPDRQLFRGIKRKCGGVREATLRGFQESAGMWQNMLDNQLFKDKQGEGTE